MSIIPTINVKLDSVPSIRFSEQTFTANAYLEKVSRVNVCLSGSLISDVNVDTPLPSILIVVPYKVVNYLNVAPTLVWVTNYDESIVKIMSNTEWQTI